MAESQNKTSNDSLLCNKKKRKLMSFQKKRKKKPLLQRNRSKQLWSVKC